MENFDIVAFRNGTNVRCFERLGAHPETVDGQKGFMFALWAPYVESVSVTGSFCDWDAERYYMERTADGDIWQLFIPGVRTGDLYKYVIKTEDGKVLYKADPYGYYCEEPPGTASRLYDIERHKWQDGAWLRKRKKRDHLKTPLNIYEVHLGSWKRHDDTTYYSYDELSDELIPYCVEMGYTHIELLPVMEHPFDGSWGYQGTGYFAPTSRYGDPCAFMRFIDKCHRSGLGVILDWVPGHFCKDDHGLRRFNGKMLYEESDHPQWGTCKFDYNRGEVKSFLLSDAVFWIEKYHVDGIRIDGVTSMLYLNFGIDDEGRKRYNKNGTEEDLAAIAFVQQMNSTIGTMHPDVFMSAEESTAWPLVTYPPDDGGLGFNYKWDMGWMHDTLNYMKTDFPFRPGNHGLLTFSLMYAFNENFILALSHDEVVHGKCSLITRMPGDYWRQFAGMRALAVYQMTHPGAKLNFMGNEIAQFIEWRYYEGLEWFLLDYDKHREYHDFIKKLNEFYKNEKALYERGYSYDGYEWLDADNNEQSIIVFARHGDKTKDALTVIISFVPEVYDDFRIGVPGPGYYREVLNSDSEEFGGSGRLNGGLIKADKIPWHGKDYSIVIKTPPIGGAVFKREYIRKPRKHTGETVKTKKNTGKGTGKNK